MTLARASEFISKNMAIWVAAGALAAYFIPGPFVAMKPFMEWFFAFTMFGIGAILSFRDFEPIFKSPRLVGLGILAQFAIMPVLAFVIARALKLPGEYAFGLILAGAVPDAMAAGVMSYLADADVALSVALTTGTTLVSPVVTPALTYLLGKEYVAIQFWPMLKSIMLMVVMPLFAGLLVKRRFHAAVDRIKPVFPAFSTLFIVFICSLVVALNRDSIAKITWVVFLAVALLNVLGLLLGYGAGILFRFNGKQRRTLAIGVGMQNAGMGAVLAIKHFSPEAAIPNALFATWCIVTAAILAEIWRRIDSFAGEAA